MTQHQKRSQGALITADAKVTWGIGELGRHVWTDGQWHWERGPVVQETPLTIFVNGRELVTAIVTPTAVDEFVYGFLALEGFIQRPDEVTVYQYHAADGQVWVRIPGLRGQPTEEFGKHYLGSCCGRGRLGFYFAKDANWPHPLGVTPGEGPALSPEAVAHLFAQADHWHRGQRSGGLHLAALAEPSAILVARSDVGRHNALDKVYGWCLGQAVSSYNRIVVFSGRISAEIVVKVAKMRCPLILSNAAPTTLGLDLAQDLGITVVGFVRPRQMSVFTHAYRIGEPKASGPSRPPL